MPRVTRRASQSTVNAVHNLIGQELARQLRAAAKKGEPISAALLSAGIAYLKLTDTRDPAPPARKRDRLATMLPPPDELDAMFSAGKQVPEE